MTTVTTLRLTGLHDAERLRLAMNGTNIKLYVDDVEKFSVTDSNVTATGKATAANKQKHRAENIVLALFIISSR